MIDIFGAVLTVIKSDPDVAAITPRVSSEIQALPCVQIIDNATSRTPFGPGSGRVGLQFWQGIGRCWAEDSPTGAITARQLAGAVSDAVHNLTPATVSGRVIHRAYAPTIDGVTRDPQTRRPFYDVFLEFYATA